MPEDRARVWLRARKCSTGACIEVAFDGETVILRNSADPNRTLLLASREDWDAFSEAVRNGEFEAA